MALNQKPIVNSFFQVADKPGLALALERGYAVDVMLQVPTYYDGFNAAFEGFRLK